MRNRNSRFVGISLAATFALGLAACGTTEDVKSERTADADDPFAIATVPKVEGITWFEAMERGVEEFDDDNDIVDAWQTGPDTEDAAKQVQIIEDLIAQDVDAMVVVPNDPQAVGPALEKARDKGIVVVTHEAPALAGTDSIDYDLEAFSNEEFGERMFEKLAEGMDGEGEFVGMVGSLTSETHMAWYNAGLDYLEENYPDITPVTDEPYEDDNNDSKARDNAQEILNAYPDLKGYVNGSVSAGSSFAEVLKEKDITDITNSGLSLPSVAGPLLDDGWMYSAQTWDPAGAGYAANAVALAILEGEDISDGMDLGYDGYESVDVSDELIKGDAIMMLEADQFEDGDYPF